MTASPLAESDSGLQHRSRAKRARAARSLTAFGVYLAFAWFTFGRGLIGHFRNDHIGMSSDPGLMSWFLQWWPHALTHGLNPFRTDLIWAPTGFNLTWTTGIPLPALAAWPITAAAGPFAAFNLLCLVALPLSGWAAFVLCRRLGGGWWSSLLGGYIFGFSSYALGQQSCGHIHMTVVLFVPLAVLTVVDAIEGKLPPRRFLLLLTAILVAQFLVCVEVFTTMTIFAALALLLGNAFAPRDTRSRLLATLPYIAGAYALAVAIVSPYLYYMLAFHIPGEARLGYSNDLLNLIVPAPTQALGVIPFIAHLSASFRVSSIVEVDGYVGLPILLLFAIYAWRGWREPLCRLLVDSFLVIYVLSLGPRFHVGGVELFGLPAKIFGVLPILDKLVPSRFMAYGFLILAIIAARWFAMSPVGVIRKIIFAAAIVLFTLPNLSPGFWVRADATPAFFATPLYRQYLKSGESVLVLPFGLHGDSMRWQAETAYYFRMAGGWSGFTPPEFAQWPIVDAFLEGAYLPAPAAQLRAFMAREGVRVVVISDSDPDANNSALFAGAWAAKEHVGGVRLYRALPDALARLSDTTPLAMEQRANSVLFDTLVVAADKWFTDGGKLAQLTPFEAQRRRLLPADWLVGPRSYPEWVTGESPLPIRTDQRTFAGAYLGGMPGGDLGVGVTGTYASLAPIAERYRADALHAYFFLASPRDLLADSATPSNPGERAPMVIHFDVSRVAQAASIARSELAGMEMVDDPDVAKVPQPRSR
jgi:hypothetical protein